VPQRGAGFLLGQDRHEVTNPSARITADSRVHLGFDLIRRNRPVGAAESPNQLLGYRSDSRLLVATPEKILSAAHDMESTRQSLPMQNESASGAPCCSSRCVMRSCSQAGTTFVLSSVG
jgi:hypothetical protein